MLVGDVLNKAAAENGDKTAAFLDDDMISYNELNIGSNKLAHGLIGLGIEPENMVSIMLPNSLEFLTAYFGVMKSGATMVPINIMFKVPAVEYILNNSEAKAV